MTVFSLAILFWGEFSLLIQMFQIIETAKLLFWEEKFRDKKGTFGKVSGKYIQMIEIIFSHIMQWCLLTLSQ